MHKYFLSLIKYVSTQRQRDGLSGYPRPVTATWSHVHQSVCHTATHFLHSPISILHSQDRLFFLSLLMMCCPLNLCMKTDGLESGRSLGIFPEDGGMCISVTLAKVPDARRRLEPESIGGGA